MFTTYFIEYGIPEQSDGPTQKGEIKNIMINL